MFHSLFPCQNSIKIRHVQLYSNKNILTKFKASELFTKVNYSFPDLVSLWMTIKSLDWFYNDTIVLCFGMIFLLVFCGFGWIRGVTVAEWFVQVIFMLEEIVCQIIVAEVLLQATVFSRQNLASKLFVEWWEVRVMEMYLIFDWLTQYWEDHRDSGVHQWWRIYDVNFHVLDGQKISLCWRHLHVSRCQPLHHFPRVTKNKRKRSNETLNAFQHCKTKTHPLISRRTTIPFSIVSASFSIASNHKSSSCAKSTKFKFPACAESKTESMFWSVCRYKIATTYTFATDKLVFPFCRARSASSSRYASKYLRTRSAVCWKTI